MLSEEQITEETAQGMAGLEFWSQTVGNAMAQGYSFEDAVMSIPRTPSAEFNSANGL